MYYKVINKESEVYKKLFDLRTSEEEKKKRNEEKIKNEAGSDFDLILYSGHQQQNFRRVPQYIGFVFKTPETIIDPKAWKMDKDHNDVFVPNRRTKTGREWSEKLANGLESSNYRKVYEIIGFKDDLYGRQTIPFMETFGDVILLYLDDKIEPENPDIVEVTKTEWKSIVDNYNKDKK